MIRKIFIISLCLVVIYTFWITKPKLNSIWPFCKRYPEFKPTNFWAINKTIDMNRFIGEWYELARNPFTLQYQYTNLNCYAHKITDQTSYYKLEIYNNRHSTITNHLEFKMNPVSQEKPQNFTKYKLSSNSMD